MARCAPTRSATDPIGLGFTAHHLTGPQRVQQARRDRHVAGEGTATLFSAWLVCALASPGLDASLPGALPAGVARAPSPDPGRRLT